MSSVQEAAPSRTRVNLTLATLFLCTFILGTAELGVVGMLDLITKDIGVSVSTAGTLVTCYALGIAIGGPLLAALTIRMPRRTLLLLSLGLYIVMTLVIALVGNFALFAVARLIGGSLHGLFVGVAFTIAVTSTPAERVGQAMSAVIGGFAVSVAFGVPLGSLIGQALGWRESFFTMVVVGVVCLVLAAVFVPSVQMSGSTNLRDQTKYAFAPRVLAVLGLAVVIFTGQYAAFTYITPFLQTVTGINGGLLSAFLLAYGAATAVGAFGGGRFAATAAGRSVTIAMVVVTLAMVGLYLVGASPWLTVVALVVWGLFGLGLVPSLQFRIVDLAGPGKDLAATLPASAINAGIAIGALAGGATISGISVPAVVITGAVVCAVAVPIAWATSFLKPPPENAEATADTDNADDADTAQDTAADRRAAETAVPAEQQ